MTHVYRILVTILLMGTLAQAQEASYRFLSLDLPNTTGALSFTTLADISDTGVLVGGFTNSSGPGYVLSRAFQVDDVICPGDGPGDLSAEPQAINGRGVSIGFCTTGGRERSFVRFPSGEIRLVDVPGVLLTEAKGINRRGVIVGSYSDLAGAVHGFIFDDPTVVTFDVPGAQQTLLMGINQREQLIGLFEDADGVRHGFVTHFGVAQPLEMPGASVTIPVDINDEGQIVGLFVPEGEEQARSFVLTEGVFTEVTVPFPGTIITEVSGLNNRGQLVGRYVQPTPDDPSSPFASHGFIATPDTSTGLAMVATTPPDAETVARWQAHAAATESHRGKWARHRR